ncbi:MAG TPA: hypothetical protein VH352_26130 [Pseudonocardiaceae bacterium]|nr:hypothetical protein [Pseudonocardiaceae bacterium]
MTASAEAGVEEFNNELGGRHHVQPDQSASGTAPATEAAQGQNNSGGVHSNDTGVPSAHTAPVPGSATETEAGTEKA